MSDLMHHKVKAFSPEIARDLGLEETFIQFVLSDSKPSCFDYWVEDHENGWTCFVPDEVKVAYPVWSTNADQTLLCVGTTGCWFAQGHHDDPEVYKISNTAQGLLAKLFISLFESEATEFALKEGAQASGFRFLDIVIGFAETESQDYSEENKLFILEIDQLALQPASEDELKRMTEYLHIDPEEFKKRQVSEQIVDMLQENNLIVLAPFPLADSEHPCGRRIAKPASAGGNVLPFENRVIEGEACDAPLTILCWEDNKWLTQTSLCLSSSSQITSFPTVEAAVRDILDLYFGDPKKMRQLHKHPYDSLEEVKDKAILLAKAILKEEIMLSEGVQNISNLALYLNEYRDLISPFNNWRHELSIFPVGEQRKLWNAKALAQKDIEREKVERGYRDKVASACQRIIRELND